MLRLLQTASLVLAASAMLCAGASAQQTGPEPDPMVAFNNHCRQCHSYRKDDNRLGPTLFGVVGRKAGTVANFPYSSGVKNSGITWDEATLDKWIAKPDSVIGDNNMSAIFGGVDDPAIRAKIIAFLKQDTTMASQQR